MSQSERRAMNAVASLLDPRVDAGAGLHAKVCDAASALIRIDDPFATQLCAVALKRMEESLDVSESLDESSDSSPRRVHAAVARVFAVPLLHTRRGEGAARVMDRMASHRVASSSSSSSPMSPIDSLWTLDNHPRNGDWLDRRRIRKPPVGRGRAAETLALRLERRPRRLRRRHRVTDRRRGRGWRLTCQRRGKR